MLKKELLAKAKELKIKGRSKMTKEELLKAIMEIEGVDGEKDGEKKEMKQQKINEMYSKVDTPPVKKSVVKKVVVKKAVAKKADPKMPKIPKMSPKMQEQLKAKMAEVQADQGKK